MEVLTEGGGCTSFKKKVEVLLWMPGLRGGWRCVERCVPGFRAGWRCV